MSKCWKIEFSNFTWDAMPEKMMKFFYQNLVQVEKPHGLTNLADWRILNPLQKKLNIEIISETEKVRIMIPDIIDYGTLYYKGYKSKSKNFLKDLRNAYAHGKIFIENNNIIKIALPYKNKPSEIKLACYLDFKDLKKIVNSLYNKLKK